MYKELTKDLLLNLIFSVKNDEKGNFLRFSVHSLSFFSSYNCYFFFQINTAEIKFLNELNLDL